MAFDPKRYDRARRIDINVGARSPFRAGFAFTFGSDLAALAVGLLRLALAAAIVATLYYLTTK